MEDNIPPVAHKRIGIDFDGTIVPWGDLNSDAPPFPHAAETIRGLKAAGWTIIILTSRLSPTWWAAEGWDSIKAATEQLDIVSNRLTLHNIPFDLITAEKIPCAFYIDDRAIVANDNWLELKERFLGGTK